MDNNEIIKELDKEPVIISGIKKENSNKIKEIFNEAFEFEELKEEKDENNKINKKTHIKKHHFSL